MSGFTLLWGETRLSADDLPDMVEDAVRTVTVKAAGIANGNTISGTPTAECDTLTIGSVTKSGTTFSFPLTADQLGIHTITLSATLSNGDTVKAYLRANVVCKPLDSSSSCDYRCDC